MNTLKTLMLEYNFHQIVKEPTRVTSTSSTCVDLLFINNKNCNYELLTKEFGFSDHRGNIFTLPIITQTPKHFLTVKRIYSEKNINNFKNELKTINWNNVILPTKNLNHNYDVFITSLQALLNKHIPKLTLKSHIKTRNYNLTPGIKLSCHNKRLLQLLKSQTKSKIIHNYCKTYNKTLRRAFLMSKKINNSNKYANATNKSRAMWQIINNEAK